jgi:two-component system chemotaxis response regulator CheB
VPKRDIVVVGASAGGFEALRRLVPELPADLPAAVFVVMHMPAQTGSMLADILAHEGALPAGLPGDGDSIRPGRIYVAPGDHHLILEERRVRVLRGPRQNRHRPAVDVLFRSAAFAQGTRVIGVVLTGMLDDGAAGLAAIKRAGGVTVVQDPASAAFPGMPDAALAATEVDHVVGLERIPALLGRLTREEAPEPAPQDGVLRFETRADLGETHMDDMDENGKRSAFTCPDCGGALWEMGEADLLRYRCHVGHGFTAQGLMDNQEDTLEETLWAAVRSLEENARLNRRLIVRLSDSAPQRAEELRDKAEELTRHADRVRKLLTQLPRSVEPTVVPAGGPDRGEG